MKTYKQFSEDMKKNFQTFLDNPQTKDLTTTIKNTKIGDFKNLKDPLKKFTKSTAVQNLKTNTINTLADKASGFTNKFFDNLRKM